MEFRQNAFVDHRLKIPRGGFARPDKAFYLGKDTKITSPTFSPRSIVVGFNLTYGDYYILLRPIIMMVLKIDLHKETDMSSDNAEFLIRPIVEEMKNHNILQKKGQDAVTPWWIDKMLSRWVAAVARWVSEHINGSKSKNIQPNPSAFKIGRSPFPRDCIKTIMEYSPHVGKEKGKMVSPDKLKINVDLHYDDERKKVGDLPLNATEIMSTPSDSTTVLSESSPLRDFTRLSYSSLIALIKDEWELLANEQWVLAYLNPYWGNETLSIQNDLELWVAVYELRIRGSDEVTLRVSYDIRRAAY